MNWNRGLSDWNRGLSVWQKLKDFFSQILGSLWKGHNKRFYSKERYVTIQNRTRPRGIKYLKARNVSGIAFCNIFQILKSLARVVLFLFLFRPNVPQDEKMIWALPTDHSRLGSLFFIYLVVKDLMWTERMSGTWKINKTSFSEHK